MKNYFKYIALIFIIGQSAMFTGCNQNIAFEKNHPLNAETGWHLSDTLFFNYEVTDTTQFYDLYINVRNTTDYRYNNFYVFFQTKFPDGQLFRDTVEMILAAKDGQWTGNGYGKLRSNSFHFRRDVWLPQAGEYQFSIQHAMREEHLTGISDLGMRMERKERSTE